MIDHWRDESQVRRMSSDEAAKLRTLMLRSLQQKAAGDDSAPRLIMVCGGRSGVGTTTLAINLSVAMALNGARVVVVDADKNRQDVALLCGLAEHDATIDVLAAGRDIYEVMQLGPAGIQVVPGFWGPKSVADFSEVRQQRLMNQLRSLHRHADTVVIDAGGGASEIVRRFWDTADQVVVTSTPNSVVVMETYALIKSMSNKGVTPIGLVVNQANNRDQADDVFHRVDKSCKRFLQLELKSLGFVSPDGGVEVAKDAAIPLLIRLPQSEASLQMLELASQLCAVYELGKMRRSKAA